MFRLERDSNEEIRMEANDTATEDTTIEVKVLKRAKKCIVLRGGCEEKRGRPKKKILVIWRSEQLCWKEGWTKIQIMTQKLDRSQTRICCMIMIHIGLVGE